MSRARWVGVDGCPGGWVAAAWDGEEVTLRAFSAFASLQDAWPRARVAIDVPIGLEEGRGSAQRPCDASAAQTLGARRSSIFPAPRRGALALAEFRAGLGVSAQTFGILPKVRQLDAFAAAQDMRRVHEAHPELAFRAALGVLTGEPRPAQHAKRTLVGWCERAAILDALGLDVGAPSDVEGRGGGLAPTRDDVLDATILAWVARRVDEDVADRFGDDDPGTIVA